MYRRILEVKKRSRHHARTNEINYQHSTETWVEFEFIGVFDDISVIYVTAQISTDTDTVLEKYERALQYRTIKLNGKISTRQYKRSSYLLYR